MTPTIIEYSDNPSSGCSYWRSIGPLNELAREGHVNIINGTWKESWVTLRKAHIAFFQRPMSKHCKTQLYTAKDNGLKIWIDLDDYPEIPPHHPVYGLYMKEYDQKQFSHFMMMADIVTVSTSYLKNHYLRYSNDIEILPNALNDHVLSTGKRSNNKTVFIRLGDHHEQDVYHYKEQIIRVMNKHKDWTLLTAGSDPKILNNEIDNYKFLGDYQINDYFGLIYQCRPEIFLVPLLEDDFNRGKSNISWQEATFAGGVAVTPEFLNTPHSLTYKDRRTFGMALDRLIKNKELRRELYKKSKNELEENYVLSKTNKQRLEIIKQLMK